jgi:hypothetical protein
MSLGQTGKVALIAFLAVGAIFRVWLWLQDRSLFIDEAMLANTLIQSSYGDLFTNLSNQVFVPPLFAVMQKLMLSLSVTELSFRVFPLICSLISLVLFYRLIRRFTSHWSIAIIAGFLATGSLFLMQSVTGKQYSVDTMLTLLLLAMVTHTPLRRMGKLQVLFLSIVGAIFVWLSMPIIFAMSGVGIYLVQELIKEKGRAELWKVVSMGLAWSASFIIYYLIIISDQMGDDHIQNYHSAYFLTTDNFGQRMIGIYTSAIDKTVLGQLWGYLLTIAGLIGVWSTNRKLLALLVVPVLITLLASGFGHYSLIPRLTLFFIPLLYLIMAIGIEHLATKLHGWAKVTVILAITVTGLGMVQGHATFMYDRYEQEELKDIFPELVTASKNDLVYVHHGAAPAFRFYNEHYPLWKTQITDFRIGKWEDDPSLAAELLTEKGAVWILFTNTWPDGPDPFLEPLRSAGIQTQELKSFGAEAYRFETR